MSLHHLAAHIQSQGRKGDTGLIHMSPGEIGALQKLAIAHGGSLTVNPVTGLPEANFMKNWLPAIVGGLTMLIPGVGPFAAMALAAGTSFGTSMAVGNSFNKSLMAGLASGAGAGLGGALGGAGAAVAGETGNIAAQTGTNALANIGTRAATTAAIDAGETFGTNAAVKTAAQNATRFGSAAPMFSAESGIGAATKQLPQIASTDAMSTGMGRFPAAFQGTGTPIYPGAAAADYVPGSLSRTGSYAPAVERAPSQVDFTPGLSNEEIFKAAGPMEKLSLQNKGLGSVLESPEAAGEFAWNNKGKLLALGTGVAGNMMSYPQSGLHPPPPQVSGYEGPYLPVERTTQFPTGPEPWTDTSEQQYFTDVNPYPGVTPYKPKSAAAGGLMGLASGGSYDDEAGQDGYAAGGEVAPNKMATPDMTAIQNYVQSISPQQYTTPNALQNYISSIGKPQSSSGPQVPDFMKQLSTAPQQATQTQTPVDSSEHNYGFKPITVEQAPPVQYAPAPKPLSPYFAFMTGMANRGRGGKPAAPVPVVDQYTPYRPQTVDITKPGGEKSTMQYTDLNNRTYNPETQQMEMPFAVGGLTSLARGGSYLDGPGDGLSDSIHATIGDRQPARLADGEFVISADVVSDIGGGSSKAGAKKLHAMMDRVRQSAHGTKKQVKKLNDRKVLVA